MTRRFPLIIVFVLTALSVIDSTGLAEVPNYKNEPSGEFLRDWLLLGPFSVGKENQTSPLYAHLEGFEEDFLESTGGEKDPQISAGTRIDTEAGSATWVRYPSPTDVVDLDEAITTREAVTAYAYCEIECSEQTVSTLSLGSNDGGKVWLNGELIWDSPQARGLIVDEDQIPVKLLQGKNQLLLKIEERGNKWAFCVRFLPLDIPELIKRSSLFAVRKDPSGVPKLHFLEPDWLSDDILQDVEIEVFLDGEQSKPVWTGNWEGETETSLGVSGEVYRKYVAKLQGTTLEGAEWSGEIPFTGGPRVTYTLFEERESDYSIVLGKDSSDSEKWAAKELQHWLKEVSGAELPIVSEPKELSPRSIVVGYNSISREFLGPDSGEPAASDESFTYRNVGPSVVIWGGRERGTMYGVMSFLEKEMGVRFYTPKVTVAPKKKRYTFEALSHSESPSIRVRNDFYFEAFDPIWAAHNRVNGAMNFREQPGGVEGYWSVHTFYPLMPPSEFFEDHPEYYSLIDGERIHERAQLCLTNDDVLRIMTERIRKTMRENPQYLIYSVSQNDWRGACQCEHCQRIVEREGNETGPVIAFVNQIAEAVEEEFPDKYIGTLAYQYTRKPCKTLKPRENVVIRLCSIECCFSHDFKSCPENQEFLEDLRGWSEIAPHLYIWDYVVNFSHYIMPYPNFRVLKSNINTFRENKAIGIMEQAAYQSRGGEFAELRAYVLSKLLWDHNHDVESAINDFMYGYYGRSGQYVRKYFDLLHNRITPDTHIHLGLSPNDQLFSDEFVRESIQIFEDAKKVADNEEIRQRVEMAELPILYLKCRRLPREAKADGSYQLFSEIVEREGITNYAESGAPHKNEFHYGMDSLE